MSVTPVPASFLRTAALLLAALLACGSDSSCGDYELKIASPDQREWAKTGAASKNSSGFLPSRPVG